jgi:hypothetical protein
MTGADQQLGVGVGECIQRQPSPLAQAAVVVATQAYRLVEVDRRPLAVLLDCGQQRLRISGRGRTGEAGGGRQPAGRWGLSCTASPVDIV